jgi:hypothetical protein
MDKRKVVIGSSLLLLAACSSRHAESASATGTYSPPPSVVASSGASASSTTTPVSAVIITKCKRDSDGYITLKGIVTNVQNDVSDVNMLFEVVDANGVRQDTLIGEVSKLAPGQKSAFYTNTTQTDAKKFTCRLLDIQYT